MIKIGTIDESKKHIRRIALERKDGKIEYFPNVISWTLSNILLIFYTINERVRIPIFDYKNIFIFWEEENE